MPFGQMFCPTCSWSFSATETARLFWAIYLLVLHYSPSKLFPVPKLSWVKERSGLFNPISPKHGRKIVNFLLQQLYKPKPVLTLLHLPLKKQSQLLSHFMVHFLDLQIPFITSNSLLKCRAQTSAPPQLQRSLISTENWRATRYVTQQDRGLPAKATELSGFPFRLSHPSRAAQHE